MGEFDEAVRFLGDAYAAYGGLRNWSQCRFEDFLFGGNSRTALTDPGFFRRNLHLWRENDAIVGLAVAERGEAVTLMTHPHHLDIEGAMVAWALRCHRAAGPRSIVCNDSDSRRRRLLMDHGLRYKEDYGVMRRFDTGNTPSVAAAPSGYRMTTFSELDDPGSYVEAVRSAFVRDSLDMDWLRRKQMAPSFSPDWIIVAVTAQGECAAFCDVRISRESGYAEIDPVGTHPRHRRSGLARACLSQAMARLRATGVGTAYIGSAAEPAVSNALYDSLFPEEKWKEELWTAVKA